MLINMPKHHGSSSVPFGILDSSQRVNSFLQADARRHACTANGDRWKRSAYPPCIAQARYSCICIERAWPDGIRRFIVFHRKRQPRDMDAADSGALLTHVIEYGGQAVRGSPEAVPGSGKARTALRPARGACRCRIRHGAGACHPVRFHAAHPLACGSRAA